MPWLLLLPASILLVTFTHYPTVATFFHSLFSNGTVMRPSRFVGLATTGPCCRIPCFGKSCKNAALCPGNRSGVHRPGAVDGRVGQPALPGRGLVRLAYFTPTILPMIAVANIWLFFYTPDIGLLDQVSALFGGRGHNWLGDAPPSCGA